MFAAGGSHSFDPILQLLMLSMSLQDLRFRKPNQNTVY